MSLSWNYFTGHGHNQPILKTQLFVNQMPLKAAQIPSLSKCSPLWFCYQCENGEPPAMVLISQKWPTMLEAAAARSHRLKCLPGIAKCAVETTAGRLTKFSCTFRRTADRLTLRLSWLSCILYLLTNALPWMRLRMYLGGKAEETPFLQRPGSLKFQAKGTKESPNQQIKHNKTTCQMKWGVLHAGNSIDISCKHILSIPWRKCLPVSRWAPACCCSMSFLFSHHTHSTSLHWKNTLDLDFGLDPPTAQSI